MSQPKALQIRGIIFTFELIYSVLLHSFYVSLISFAAADNVINPIRVFNLAWQLYFCYTDLVISNM